MCFIKYLFPNRWRYFTRQTQTAGLCASALCVEQAYFINALDPLRQPHLHEQSESNTFTFRIGKQKEKSHLLPKLYHSAVQQQGIPLGLY